MKITEEIIEQAYIHAKSTGKTPDTLRISEELWYDLKKEADQHEILIDRSPDGPSEFNGMDVTVVNAGEFFRYSIQ